MHLSSNRKFTRLEAARALNVPLSVIEILVENRVITLAAKDIEAFFRDSLMRLYYAQAQPGTREPEAEIEFDAQQPEPEPERPMELIPAYEEDFKQTFAKGRADLRKAPRYEPRRKVTGTFREMEFTVLEISAQGIRVRHDQTLRAGDEAKVLISIPDSKKSFMMRARVVWTTIADAACMSGLRVTANVDALQQAIEQLRRGDAQHAKRRPSPANRTPPALVGLSDEDVAAIIRAFRRFSADPVEAGRWYSRARFAITDDKVRKAAPERAADREEVLGIWEYLERRVDIGSITSVVNWLRQTRSAAAV